MGQIREAREVTEQRCMKTFPDLHKAARDPPLGYSKMHLPTQRFGWKVIFVVQNLIKSFSLNWRRQRIFFF